MTSYECDDTQGKFDDMLTKLMALQGVRAPLTMTLASLSQPASVITSGSRPGLRCTPTHLVCRLLLHDTYRRTAAADRLLICLDLSYPLGILIQSLIL